MTAFKMMVELVQKGAKDIKQATNSGWTEKEKASYRVGVINTTWDTVIALWENNLITDNEKNQLDQLIDETLDIYFIDKIKGKRGLV